MELLVVGAGDVGRWFAEVVDAETAFADRDPDAARAAADALDGRAVPLDGAERFDAVCVAVPIPAVGDAIREHADRAERAVFDVAGAMEPAVTAMREHVPDRERASFHPLFAPANEPGNVALVADEAGPLTDRVVDRLEARGDHVFETTAAEHDEAMETVQAKAHAAVLAYAIAGEDVPEEFNTPVSGPLADLVANVTAGDARVYADIQRAFDGAEEVADAAERIADADPETFAALFREARGGEGR